MLLRFLAIFVALSAVLHAQNAELGIEFSGVLISDGKPKLALTDKASGTTRWIEPGESFNGYTIEKYDSDRDLLVMKKDGQEHRLSLVAARSPDAAPPAELVATEPTLNAIRGNLRQLAAAARQFQLERGTPAASFADLVGPDKYIKELRSVAGESYAALTITPDTNSLSVTTANGANVSIELQPATVANTTPAAPSAGPAAAQPPVVAPPVASNPMAAAPSPPSPSPVSSDSTLAAPSPTGATYIVQPGDTLAKIAAGSGLSVQQLQALNPAVNPAALQSGQSIRLR